MRNIVERICTSWDISVQTLFISIITAPLVVAAGYIALLGLWVISL